MKTLKDLISLKYLILGLIIAFVIHSTHSCKKENGNTGNPQADYIDTGKIDDAVKSVSVAFLSGDVNKIKSILTDEALSKYGNDLSKVTKTNLIKLGEALKNCELKVGGELYAEYSFTKDGIQFSIAMARQEDGSWKLMRF